MNCRKAPLPGSADCSLPSAHHTARETFRIRQSRIKQDFRTGEIKRALVVSASGPQTGNAVPPRSKASEELKPAAFSGASSTGLLTPQPRIGDRGEDAAASVQNQTEAALPENSLPDDPASQAANQPAGCLGPAATGAETSPAPPSFASATRAAEDYAPEDAPETGAKMAPPCASTSPQQGGPEQPENTGQNAQPENPQPQNAQPRIPGNKGDPIRYDANGHAIQNESLPPDYGQQPKRIMGWIPNFRAVSAGARPTPPTFDEKFMLSTHNSFDYAAIIFNAVDSEFPYILKSYPQFGNGLAGYGNYYWHGFVDKTIGSYMTTTLLPTLTSEDTRYYELGTGHWYVRAIYAYTRILITPSDAGRNTFNFSEIVGKGAAAGLGNLYYPAAYTSWTKTGQRWLVQVAIRDGGFNLFREFWPDINRNILRVKPKSP